MLVTLPDNSVVNLDEQTLKYRTIDPVKPISNATSSITTSLDAISRVDIELLVRCLQKPPHRFCDCFRRVCDIPRYSPKGDFEFSAGFLSSIYSFHEYYKGGTFSSSDWECHFLDGGIISHNGYGWGSHSWTVIQGAEAIRACCLFYGVQQPRIIKGEGTRRPLSFLLDDMTNILADSMNSLQHTDILPIKCTLS